MGIFCKHFSANLGKKKYSFILFFSRTSFKATHLTGQQFPFKKGTSKLRPVYFFYNKNVYCFFLGNAYYPPTHSFSGGGKKVEPRKKNTNFSHTHSIFAQKCQKFNFSEEKNTVPLHYPFGQKVERLKSLKYSGF